MALSFEEQYKQHRCNIEAMERRLGDEAQKALAAELLRKAGATPRTPEEWKSYHQSVNAWMLSGMLLIVWLAVAGPRLGLF